MTLTFLLSGAFAQTNYDTISATYSSGNISTDNGFKYLGDVSTCPGVLNVVVPEGSTIVGVDVEYSMTAIVTSRMNDARTQLFCTSPNGTGEAAVYNGTGGWGQGTEAYSRTGLDIANNVAPPPFGQPITFELHAGNGYWGAPAGCSDAQLIVDDGTWTVTVIYLPPGSPGFPSNPTPVDMATLVDLDTDLSWDFGANVTTYDVYFGTDNPPMTKVVDNATASGTTGTYDPGTMLEATEYFWKVVGKNGTNDNPGYVWSFTTKCAAPTYPYFENFDGVTAPDFPNCWIPLSGSTSEYSVVKINTWGSLSAPNSIIFNADAEPTPNLVLVLPEIGTISDKMLSLYGKNDIDWLTGNAYTFPIEVGTITDPSDINTFTSYTSFIPGSDWTILEVYFANYTGTDTYIAIKGLAPQYSAVYVDDVTVDLLPSCIKPNDLVADEVLAEQATISWNDMNGASSWNIEVVLADSIPTGVPTFTGVTNPATITGLLDGTYYDIYVQADCGGGDVSTWSWPLRILTQCLPWDMPIFEDFGVAPPYPEVPAFPLCWSNIEINGAQYGGMGIQDYNSISGLSVWFSPEADAASELILISPPLSPAINTLRLSFWAKSSGDDRALIVGTITDPADETTFTPYDTITGMSNEYDVFTFYFNNYVGTDNYIAWRHNSAEYPVVQVSLDDITIEEIPSCAEPYQINVSGLTSSSAILNWTDLLEVATDWEIETGAQGFTPGTGAETNAYTYNSTAALTQSYEMTGLSASTLYDVYIRTDCGAGDYSGWVGPVTFLTGFNSYTLPYSEDFEDGFGTTANDWQNTSPWEIVGDLAHSGDSSVWAPLTATNYQVNTLFVTGIFDMTAKANQMLTFWHIPKTDGKYDHCYVEISTDGGEIYTQLPESTYFGTGDYYVSTSNGAVGPAFDENSYPEYGTQNTQPDNSWWRKEYFDLTDYNMETNVVFRFRLHMGYNTWPGWWIDDVAIEALGTPAFNVDPITITEDVIVGMPVSVDMTLGNTGNFPASYTANVVYDEVDLLTEDFDTGIPVDWTVVNNGNTTNTWIDTLYSYTFDGTPFVWADSYQNYGDVTNTFDEELITPVIDASSYVGGVLQLEFDQAFDHYSNAEDTARVYVYNGTDWIEIYKAWNDDGLLSYNKNGVHKVYDVSQYANANFQVKFRYEEQSTIKRGKYFAIDNFRLRASMFPLGWLTVDGAETTSGVSLPDADGIVSLVDVNMDALGLAPGTYTADIEVTSTDAGNPSTTIPVTMNVIAGVVVDIDVFLEGPYDANGMFTDLNTGGYIPLDQPYNPLLPYYGNNNPDWLYFGTESVTEIPAGAVDWVEVQVRDAADAASAGSGTVIGTTVAFLMDDGSIVGLDGVSRVPIAGASVTQNLFVVVYHRNHLGVMSGSALTMVDGIYAWDFTSGEAQAYGGINGHKDLGDGNWGMIAADGDGNGLVQSSDEQLVWKIELGTSGYLGGDFSLNGLIQSDDENNIWKTNSGTGGQIPTKSEEGGYQSQIPK